ncbi:type II secretion system minor pseudopilin GspK [Ferrimonas sp. SCSIO 43195]|uniref:type II secretion system minor pseudopilin GspK n=2 Tax=Ferrimonas TaxID=44011 RepID=UPI00041EB1B1|nr:type II secretion system minor pseudopilin GspK [Ferrimonas kyonanensis]USD37807.1 type II secretion system minor pseudopilin GspK [Ferrimonas sp. SCSIO 43195]
MKRQQGIALLTVLLVLAVMTTIAASFSERSRLAVRRTVNHNQYEQAYWFALSAEELAKRALKQDMEDADGTVHLQQYWATADVIYPVEGGQIIGHLDDMRSCFNINALSQGLTDDEKKANPNQKPMVQKQFQAMLEDIGFDLYMAEMAAERLHDYLDADDRTQGSYGAEDADYEAREVPYRAANQPMWHHSEMRAVLGISQPMYKALKDYVCVIPGDSTQIVNVNTVPVERASLLVGMFNGELSRSQVEDLIGNRPQDGWESIDKFWEESAVQGVKLDDKAKSSFVVDSSHFRFRGAAKVDNTIFRLESILQRSGGTQFVVLTRQYGGQQ